MKHVLMAATAFAAACATPAAAAPTLSFIGQQIIPTGYGAFGTTVGGLSGIDYDKATNTYISISDDRSQVGPARYYSLKLDLDASSFNGVNFTGVTNLKTPSGTDYATFQIDPESIRHLANGNIIYTSEGDTNRGIDAFIREAKSDGTFVRDLTLPAGFQQTGPSGTTGIRNNLAFESVTVSADGQTVTSATENALRQDGPASAFGVGSPSRIFTTDFATGNPLAQFVYNVNPVAHSTNPAGLFSTNGLVELLDIGHGKYVAVERSFVSGFVTPTSSTGNSIQIYLVDTKGATDVSGLASLVGENYTPVSKTLLFDLDSLGIPLDNIEGVTLGQGLGGGQRSLVLVSDNNFSPTQFTQFLAFNISGVPEPTSWAMMLGGFGLVGGGLRRRQRTLAVA